MRNNIIFLLFIYCFVINYLWAWNVAGFTKLNVIIIIIILSILWILDIRMHFIFAQKARYSRSHSCSQYNILEYAQSFKTCFLLLCVFIKDHLKYTLTLRKTSFKIACFQTIFTSVNYMIKSTWILRQRLDFNHFW